MRTLLFSLLLACGPAEAGDLWMDVHIRGTDEIHLHVPANWVADSEEPVRVKTASGEIDLTAEARALRGKKVGSSTRWDLKDEGSLELHHLKVEGDPAKTLAIQTRGPKGKGLTATMELSPQQVGQATGPLEAALDVDGVKLDIDEALCDQLKASPPTKILETTGPKGGGITVSTR